jgi:predicted esterase
MPTVDGWELDLSPPLPPAAFGHGTHDPVITVDWSRQARERIESAGGTVLYRESPMAHTIDPQFAHELAGFVRDALP